MDIVKQLETWVRQKKWDKIIRTVEKIKPEKRSVELNFMLAVAYLKSAQGWEDRKKAKKALDLLRSLADAFDEQPLWNGLVAEALGKLERFSEAADTYAWASGMAKTEAEGKVFDDLSAQCRDLSGESAFTEPFSTRVTKTWEEFVKREAEFRNILDKDVEGKRAAELNSKVSAVLRIALDDEVVVVNKADGKYRLFLVAGNNLLRLFEELYLKERAPASVQDKWEIFLGPSPVPYDSPEDRKSKNSLDDVQVWFSKGVYGLFDLVFYVESKQKADSTDELIEMLDDNVLGGFLLVMLGEAAYCKYLDAVYEVEKPEEDEPIQFKDIPEFFKSKGIDINDAPKAILEKMVEYKGIAPGLGGERHFREDVITGSSMATKVIYAFNAEEFDMFFQLEADGALVCTLYFSNESFVGDDRDEKILKYRQSVEKELMEKAGFEAVKIIGNAHGKFWEYIDMIAWNPQKVYDVAKDIAKSSPVEPVIFHISSILKPEICFKGDWLESEDLESVGEDLPILASNPTKNKS